jgi:hypothetical protein
MRSLKKSHQFFHKLYGFFPQWSHHVIYLDKDLMQAHQNKVES